MFIKTTILIDENVRKEILQRIGEDNNSKVRGALTKVVREALEDWLKKHRST